MGSRNRKYRIVRFSVLAVALILMGIGLWKQEQTEVLGKAVRICLECIGIG
jgi:uncharacterized membrane protein